MITWQYQTVTLGYRFIDDSWQIAQNPGTGQAEEGSMFFVCFFFFKMLVIWENAKLSPGT